LPNNSEYIYISVDVEASGPIPGEYSMLSIGACEVGNIKNTFYIEIQPITEKFIPEAMKVNGLSLENLKKNGVSPHKTMRKFADWVKRISDAKRPVFVAFNLAFDWSFVSYYFVMFGTGYNPFGISGIDAESVWFGKTGCTWSEASKTHIKRALGLRLDHTHNALDDAKEQAIIFQRIIGYN
jgi:DNA polymerase III epsilon subunit-like protein